MIERKDTSAAWRKRALALLLSGAAIWLVAVLAAPVWAIIVPQEYVVELQLDGVACGSHLKIAPGHFEVKPGTVVRFVNRTPWHQSVRVTESDHYTAAPLAASENIAPNGSWTARFWRSGDYYVVSENQWQYLAGLRSSFSVQRLR